MGSAPPLHGARVAIGIALMSVLGCGRDAQPQTTDTREQAGTANAKTTTTLELGPIRRALVDGLEAAAKDPAIAARLGLTAAIESPELGPTLERALARVTQDPELGRVADEFFAAVQDSPAMRAALVEFAKQNPELELSELTTGFVTHVDRRLTRTELAEQIELALRLQLRASDALLVRALVLDADASSAIASIVLARLGDPTVVAELGEWLGREGLQELIERRVADPTRAGELLAGFGAELSTPAGLATLAEILDDPRSATLFAAALARLLQQAEVREHCEQLFALALAPELDTPAIARALRDLFDEQRVRDEADALLRAIASEPSSRTRIRELLEQLPPKRIDELLLAALD